LNAVDVLEDDSTDEEAPLTSSPLVLIFSLLLQSATSATAGQESLLLAATIMKKIAKNYTFKV
jgi:hypothetical protein